MNQTLVQALKAMNDAAIDYRIVGGWGLDLFLGFESREHKDVDILVRDDQLARCVAALLAAGFTTAPGGERVEGVVLRGAGGVIDITRYAVDPDGRVRTFGIYAPIVYPDGFLEPVVLAADGVNCLTLSVANHVALKRAVAAWQGTGLLRAEDFADLRLLEEAGLL